MAERWLSYIKEGGAKWLAGMGLAALLLSRPQAAAAGAARAMADWYAAVAPALFPFLALMPLLTCDAAASAYEKLLGRPARALFGLPGAAAPALVIGMLSGSPAGALAARRLAARSGMNRGQLRRIVAAACGLSPAFLLSGVGAGMLGSAALGRVLLRAQLMAQLTTALLLRRAWRGCADPVPDPPARAEEQPVRAAALALLTVCGYMALAGALAAAARAWLGGAADALMCLADVPSGARIVAAAPIDLPRKLALLAAMCGFGGVCVGAQNLAALKGCGVTPVGYFAPRLLSALLAAGFARAQLCLPAVVALPAAVARFAAVARPAPMPVAALAAAALAVPVLAKWRKMIS